MRLSPALLVFFLPLVVACESGCKNRILERIPSPGGDWDAVAYVRGCGATTRPTANVSLVRSGKALPDDPGNLLLIDEPAVMAERHGDITLVWPAPDTLAVLFRNERNVVRRATRFQDVTVRYGKM